MPSAGPIRSTPLPEKLRKPLFIDRNSGGRLFKGMIEKAGIEVFLHDEKFATKTEDHAWLTAVGESGWLLVSGDDATTRTPLFLYALNASHAHVFILPGLNGASSEKKAECVINAWPLMCQLANDNRPPAIWRIGKDSKARLFDFRKTWKKCAADEHISVTSGPASSR
jgi:hypothetical protein